MLCWINDYFRLNRKLLKVEPETSLDGVCQPWVSEKYVPLLPKILESSSHLGDQKDVLSSGKVYLWLPVELLHAVLDK